jgi:hypothetical protein
MAVKVPSKLHTMSPTFQKAWYKRNKMELPPHLTGSVKQASKEVKPSERVKKLQTKSLQAYGATKGLKVGGEHGSGEMKDTIAPLTRDQHSKVQAAARAAKAAEKSAAKKTPLTKSQRMSAIAAAVRKAQTKHDVPTMEPDDEGHDDLRDLHQSLHIRKGYNEEVEQVDEMDKSQRSSSRGAEGLATGNKATPVTGKKAAADALKLLKKKVNPVKEEVEQIEEASPMIKPPTNRFDKKSDAFAHAEKHGGKVYKQTYTDSKGQQTVSYSVKKEEVEMNEASKAEAEKLLGGPVKTRTGNEPKGKLPLGFRQARNLARKAMRGGVSAIHRSMEKTMQKENVTESTTEVNEMSSHGKALAKAIMAKQSKRPIAQMMGEAGDEPKHTADAGEYDYEGDMAKSQLKSIITNAQRLHDMLEDTTNLPEWVQSKITLAEDYVLTAANYMEGEMNEEVEQVDEKINLVKAKMGDVIKDFKKSDAPQFKGKSMEKRREMAIAAKLGAEREAGMREEAEGTVAVTPKEKDLAAHHGDPKKITYGDVIKARLKSAAAKKMGK